MGLNNLTKFPLAVSGTALGLLAVLILKRQSSRGWEKGRALFRLCSDVLETPQRRGRCLSPNMLQDVVMFLFLIWLSQASSSDELRIPSDTPSCGWVLSSALCQDLLKWSLGVAEQCSSCVPRTAGLEPQDRVQFGLTHLSDPKKKAPRQFRYILAVFFFLGMSFSSTCLFA